MPPGLDPPYSVSLIAMAMMLVEDVDVQLVGGMVVMDLDVIDHGRLE